jgi:NitT/TauT family transport system ATP-binding protein
MSASGFISVRNLTKTLGEGPDAQEIIRDCSFTADEGRLTVMIGPSGCGKSTLIRLLAGFSAPTSGEILVGGQRITGPSVERLVVFQESALFPWMRSRENVAYGPLARGVPDQKARAEVIELLTRVGLQSFAEKFPAQLSGGMQRRAELARAMVNHPRMMILDEPFRGLDAMSRELMWNYYAALYAETRNTHFFVTTDIDEAIYLGDRILVMSNQPMKLRAVIEVDLPRPRSMAMLMGDRANQCKLEALTILHEEAMRSFTGGSLAAADFVEAYARRFAP